MKAVGIDVQATHIFTAKLARQWGKISIKGLSQVHKDDVKRLYKEGIVVSGLGASSVLVRKFSLPLKNKRLVKKAVRFKINSLHHIPLEERVDHVVSPSDSQEGSFLCLTTTKRELASFLEDIKNRGCDPERVSFAPQALARFLRFTDTIKEEAYALYIGSENSLLIFYAKGELQASVEIALGSQDFLSATPQEELSLCWKKEFEKAFYSLQKEGAKAPLPFAMVGQIDKIPFLEKEFLAAFPSHLLPLSLPNKECIPYALSIGYALEALAVDDRSIQFLKKEFLSSISFKRVVKKSALFFCSSLAASTLLLGLGERELKKRSETLQTAFERVYKTERMVLSDEPSLQALQECSFEEKFNAWERALQKEQSLFPYFPPEQGVKELLLFVDTHPSLKEGVDLKEVTYKLESFPSLVTPNAPYKIQLDLVLHSEKGKGVIKEIEKRLKEECPTLDPKNPSALEELGRGLYKLRLHLLSKGAIVDR